MPVNISKTNLRLVDERHSYVDLYEVEKSEYDLPYAMCLREPLEQDCEYHGYSFAMRLYPFSEQAHDDTVMSHDEFLHRMHTNILRVRYHEYIIGCRQGYYSVKSSKRRIRFVKINEFAAGPYFAMLFATKPDEPLIFIEDVMAQLDPLYSSMDSKTSNTYEGSDTQFIMRLFRQRVMQASTSRVAFISPTTTDVDEIKRNVRDIYLNIVHDCNRYCAISSLGRFGTVPFTAIKQDGLRCARALIELPYSETYETVFYSTLNKSKGRPHQHRYNHAYQDGYYRSYAQDSSLSVNQQTLYELVPQLAKMHHDADMRQIDDIDASTSTVAIVIGCVLPAVVGSAMVAYVVRSNSKLAQNVRNKLASIIQTIRGMQRVNTADLPEAHITEMKDITQC